MDQLLRSNEQLNSRYHEGVQQFETFSKNQEKMLREKSQEDF